MAGAFAEFFGKLPQVRGARIFGAIHAVAEPGNLHLVRQLFAYLIYRGIRFRIDFEQEPDHVFIGAAVQRSLQRADRGGNSASRYRKALQR